MKKVILAGIIPSLLLAVSVIDTCFADGWQGSGNFGTAAGNGVSAGNGDYETSTAWVHFKYVGGADFEGQSIWIVPQYTANLTQPLDAKLPNVDGKCAKQDVGFWTLARISKPKAGRGPLKPINSSDVGDYREKGLDDGNEYFFNGIEATYLKRWGDYYTKNTYINGNGEYMIYRNMQGTGWSIFDTLSYNNATGNYAVKNPGGATAEQVLYYGTGGNDDKFGSIKGKIHKMYQLNVVANGMNDVYKSYRAYLVASKTKTQDQVNGMTDSDIDKLMRNAGGSGNGTYAFCSYENVIKKEASLDTKSQIKIYDNDVEKRSNLSGWDTETSDNNIYEFNTSGSFKLNFNFAYNRSASDFGTNAISNGSSISVYRADANGNNIVELYSKTLDTPGFKMGVTTLNNQHAASTTTSFEELEADTVYMFCAYIKHAETVTITNDVQTTSGQGSSKACVKAKYKPITATIDSDTRATLDGINYDSGADTSKTFPNANNYITVEAGPNTVTWSHYLGWTSRSDNIKTGNVWTKTYGLNGTKALGNALSVGKYNKNSHTIYLKKDDDGYPGMKGDNNTSEAGVFPGEAREVSQSLKHPSIVQVNSGDAATGSSDESSSVKLRLKAEDIQCGISKDSYGLDEDIVYSIGVDNPNDYRWLSIKNDNNIKKTVGDDTLQNDVFWLKPESQIQITQTACFGSQIKIDADNVVEDRFNTNPWKNQDYTNDSANSVFGLESWIPADRGLFDDTEAPNDVGSHHESSLAASEIGISDFSKVSTPSSRVANGYKIETISNAAVIENLGKSLYTSFSKPNRESVSITTKIPYNYYMSLNLAPDDSKGYLTSENTTFTVNIKNEGRINTQVCNDTSQCGAYATKSKKTTAGMLVFTISSEFKADDLKEGKDSFSYNGNIFDSANDLLLKNRMVEAVKNHLPYGDSIDVIDSSHVKDEEITDLEFNDGGTGSIESNILDLSNLAVGTKVCAVAAVYPSDSHDTGYDTDYNRPEDDPKHWPIDDSRHWEINDLNQSAAFSPTGTKTGLKVSCRTVAKHQNMSVEGNGVVTTQTTSSSNTTHNNRIFRSWSEYQIISGGSNASSGAVTAYALNNMAGKTENMSADPDFSSVSSGSYLYPQTLGNYSLATIGGKKSDPNSGDESQVNWRYSETLIKNIVDTYGKGGSDCVSGDLPTSNNYLECINGGNLPYVYKEGKDTLVVKSTGTLTINNDSHLEDLSYWGNPKQLIIIAKDILIDKSVSRVNAWLIVDGGKLNTCNDYQINAPEDKSNQNLLDFCNTQLFINGPVIVNGDLILPRTFGGGSVLEKGEFVKDPNTLVQRAEIFNYDPSVVEWAYRESQKNPHLETTYTETLAPRL